MRGGDGGGRCAGDTGPWRRAGMQPRFAAGVTCGVSIRGLFRWMR